MEIKNFSLALFLVRKDIRAVMVSYERHPDGKGVEPFTMFKTLDPSIGVGDFVVIPTGTRHEMTVARVEQVDVRVDHNSTKQVDWIVSTFQRDTYAAILAAEHEAIEKIKDAEDRRRAEELAEKLVADNPDLALLRNLDMAALPAPPVADEFIEQADERYVPKQTSPFESF